MEVGQFKRKFQVEGDIGHKPPLVSENYNDYTFITYQNIGSMFYSFVTKIACDRKTDSGRTDRQSERQMDRITIPKTALA